MKYLFYISLLVVFVGCYESDPVLSPLDSSTVDLRISDNNNQAVYLKLENKQITNDSSEVKWHLKFENAPNDWLIYLNPLENVVIHPTTITNFNEVDSNFNLVGLEWITDAPNSTDIKSAINEWGDFAFDSPKSFKNVIIVRVKDGLTASFYKMQMLDANQSGYRVRYGTLNGKYDHTILIKKDNSYTHSYLRLAENPVAPLAEPKRVDWDVCFTYIADSISKHGVYPHLNTVNPFFGVYHAITINQEFAEVAIERSVAWADIDYFLARKLTYARSDQISNEFVFWNDTIQQAELVPNVTVILKINSTYYKMKGRDLFGEFPSNFALRLALQKL